jgi:K+-sensing histidine kinase KdpD
MIDWERELDASVLAQALELLAHDLRNPLSALHSNLGYLKNVAPGERDSDDVEEAIADGVASCEGLSHIIANLGVFAQLVRGGSARSAPPAKASGFVQAAVAKASGVAQSFGTDVEVDISEGARGLSLNASGELLPIALANLVLNSIQCSPRRSRVLIRVEGAAEGREVVVSFLDGGPPLEAPDALELRGHLASKTKPGGRYNRWLGLYVAGIAARAMGGDLNSTQPVDPFTSALRLTLPAAS